jgi:hypothetical protein
MPKAGDTRPCKPCDANGVVAIQTFKLQEEPPGTHVLVPLGPNGELIPSNAGHKQDAWVCENGHHNPD